MENGTIIGLKHLNFWYNEKQVLFDINLSFPEKKITALIGPSGCGKSTLLRCINRMNDLIKIAKTSGEVTFRKKNIYSKETDVVELRKKIGMVFQKPNPFPATIFENVAYGLRIQHVNGSRLEQTVKKSLEKAELWEEVKDRLDLSAFRLSGGQQQRLCIARAIAIEPDIILLDEPCSSLDPIATAKIEELLKKLKKEKTIIIVTHNMAQAKRISDNTCYLLNGKVIEHGETKQVFSRPKNRLTADYIDGKFG